MKKLIQPFNHGCVFVLGSSGYIGNALVQRLLANNYVVIAIDNESRHKIVAEYMGSASISPESNDPYNRLTRLRNNNNSHFIPFNLDIVEDFKELEDLFLRYRPMTIVNLAHQPSGPFSMIDEDHAEYTLFNNIMATNHILWMLKKNNPDVHYITIGSTGEYSHYSNIDIEEGYFTCEHKGRISEEMIYPRKPTSIYHTSKVASTYLIDYCTRIWNLHTTDIMQAVVFGMHTDEIDKTKIYSRFDVDECMGSVINRFIAQAMAGVPLTIFGEGNHKRGFIALNDSIQALMIAIQNRPLPGRTRVWNQLSEWHSINDIAKMVKDVGNNMGMEIELTNTPSLRHECTSDHYYYYVTDILASLGYKPTRNISEEVQYCMNIISEYITAEQKELIKKHSIPKIQF